jgi:hypothetical protein
MEALSWGSTYRNFANAQAAIAFPVTAPRELARDSDGVPSDVVQRRVSLDDVRAVNQSIPLICFWAFDYFCLFSWPLPLPNGADRAVFL